LLFFDKDSNELFFSTCKYILCTHACTHTHTHTHTHTNLTNIASLATFGNSVGAQKHQPQAFFFFFFFLLLLLLLLLFLFFYCLLFLLLALYELYL
jgi:hypothetical protein